MNFIEAEITDEGLKFADIVVPISDSIKEKFANRKAVTIGIRPENMTYGETRFTVDVEISEMLGSEKIAYFDIQGSKCSAKLSPDFEIGEKIELSVTPENMLFFDKETGKNIFS